MNLPSSALDLPMPVAARAAPVMVATGGARPRLDSVDLLRGVVMIVMALDHTRDYFSAAHFDPTDLAQTTPALFLTRWITHFCAPVFMLLAGTGAYLSLGRGRSKADLSRFLLSRGLWLVLLELTVVKFGWESVYFDPLGTYGLAVIWALGWCMVALAALIHLPMRGLVAVSAAMVLGHNLLDGIAPSALGPFAWLWQVLHVPTMVTGAAGPLNAPGLRFLVAYPLVPWIGVMALGYALGALLARADFTADPVRRQWLLARLGVALTLGFIALRALNVYGDAAHWATQPTPLFTALSFLNTTKYPPSLLYLLMTLGPALVALAAFERWHGRGADFVCVFGRVPLFYYLLHLILISSLSNAVYFTLKALGHAPVDADWGWGLPVVYAIWIGVVLALYLPCRWFAAVKARRREAWLSYL